MKEINPELINKLNRLSKAANQRILRIERLTKRKSPSFAVYELEGYLKEVNATTKRKGRSIRASKYKESMTETEVIGAIKALENFMESEYSSVRGIKAYTAKLTEFVGKKITPQKAATIYQAGQNKKFIEDHTQGSDFWTYYSIAFKPQPPTFEEFMKDLETLWADELPIDEKFKPQLKNLYYYLRAD